MNFIDYYHILGLEKSASTDDVKKAYRKLARRHHPDLNPTDKTAQKKFQEINEANEVLSDPVKRKKYDQYGKEWKHADAFEKENKARRNASQTDRNQSYNDSNEDYFSDFFASMFGSTERKTSQAKFKGQDYKAALHLSLAAAYSTHQQTITVNSKNVRITIHAGIQNDQVIKLKGYGSPGTNSGSPGDLYITLSIDTDPKFKRLGNDLHTTVDLNLYVAVLGGDITIDTFGGKIKLKVKPETQNGTKIRLKGKGFPVYKTENQFGDLYVTYIIKLPTNLTDKQKDLFMQLSKM